MTLVHHKGAYNFYLCVSNDFMFPKAMSLLQIKTFMKNEYGAQGLNEFAHEIELAQLKGHCMHNEYGDLEEFLCFNRAGENKTELTYQQCLEKFLTLPPKKEPKPKSFLQRVNGAVQYVIHFRLQRFNSHVIRNSANPSEAKHVYVSGETQRLIELHNKNIEKLQASIKSDYEITKAKYREACKFK